MTDIEGIISALEAIKFHDYRQYTYDLLSAFKLPSATIDRLLSKASQHDFQHPVSVYRRAIIMYGIEGGDGGTFSGLTAEEKNSYRLLICISDATITCKDLRTEESIESVHEDVYKHTSIFFPLIYGRESHTEPDATVDFSEIVGSLFTNLCVDQKNVANCDHRSITGFVLTAVYLSFCESILDRKELSKAFGWVGSHGGESYNEVVRTAFDAVLFGKGKSAKYGELPHWPFCAEAICGLPNISEASFECLASLLQFDLSNVDTEILGSLMYRLVSKEDSTSVYGHQTTYQNVVKTLNPLFVDEVAKQIALYRTNSEELSRIRKQLLQMKFFDPTNGPGGFLTSAMTQVMYLIEEIDEALESEDGDIVDVARFIGLVDNDVTKQLGHLCLWVSYIQFLRFRKPIRESDLESTFARINIQVGDQLLTNWTDVCSNDGNTFIIGSPTFKGKKNATAEEKRRMGAVFGTTKSGDSDLCSCWLYLAAKYIRNTNSKCSLVLTNSVCQGSQVSFIWKRVHHEKCDIAFAIRSFKWQNQTANSSGVSVVVIGLACSLHNHPTKRLYVSNSSVDADCIGPYLVDSTRTIVESKKRSPISNILPLMPRGNMPYDGGHLLLSKDEKKSLVDSYPEATCLLKRILGSEEYINRIERWCLWIPTEDLNAALAIPPIAERISMVRHKRESSSDSSVRRMAKKAHQFREFNSTTTQMTCPHRLDRT